MAMRIAIVGCGLIGHKRARALGPHALVAVADADPARAQKLAALHPGCEVVSTWQGLVGRSDVDIVVVATTNRYDAIATFDRKLVNRLAEFHLAAYF